MSEDPFPHVEITVSPTVPVVQIAETWIAALRGQRVELVKPAPWFLQFLGLQIGDVSAEVIAFLGLGELLGPVRFLTQIDSCLTSDLDKVRIWHAGSIDS